MANLINTLYPPVVSTFQRAFINTTSPKIYFTLSPFNEEAKIKRVHVSLVNQLNNENALALPGGILFSDLNYEESSGLYYVVIPVNSLIGEKGNTANQFNINQFYKVQLRFDTYDGKVPTTNAEKTQYLIEKQSMFSEWSSVCLIRPILKPDIALRTFDTYTGQKTIAFNKGMITISGKMFFGENGKEAEFESETQQSYQIQVIEDIGSGTPGNIVYETPMIYTGGNINPNDIYTKIDLQSVDTSRTTKFILRVKSTTKNLFEFQKEWPFIIADFLEEENFDPDMTVTMNNETGVATLSIKNPQTVFGTVYVKRASSVSNFKQWEDIQSQKIAGPINLEIHDNTVSSFIWYRYSIQMENSKGAYTNVYHSETFMPNFYDAFISRGNQQFCIKYNYNISNMKPVVNRAKVDTLGGKYPKFAENAVLNYKQFSISGLISAEEDPYQLFLNKRVYFGDSVSGQYRFYEVYKNNFGIKENIRNDLPDYFNPDGSPITTTEYDYLWEREFREELVKWLNDGEPKLYRSATEGAMAVMLTDISLTPNTDLSRRIWSFSATMYEIEEADSLETLDALGIFNRQLVTVKIEGDGSGGSGPINPEIDYVEVVKVGQLHSMKIVNYESSDNSTNGDKTIPANANVLDIIMNNLRYRYGGVLSKKDPRELQLKNIKIYFQSKPNIFVPDNYGNLVQVQDISNLDKNTQQSAMLGYVFEIKTKGNAGYEKFFVNSRGYYQIPDSFDVEHFTFPSVGDVVTIEYTMIYKESNANNIIVSGSSIDRTVVGQESGVYYPNVFQGERIRAKYNFVKTGESFQKMNFWKGICLDVTPYAVARIKYRKDKEYQDYIVGQTGVFHMIKDMEVEDMCFLGRRMSIREKERQKYLDPWECVYDESVESGFPQGSSVNWHSLQEVDSGNKVAIYDAENSKPNTNINESWGSLGASSRINSGYPSTDAVNAPKNNTVYNIAGRLMIYYQQDWYNFVPQGGGTGIAVVPVEGMINYYGQVVISTY